MRRVVVTGMGIVSSIGNNANEVLASLREARSGIVAAPEYSEKGMRCQVHGMGLPNAQICAAIRNNDYYEQLVIGTEQIDDLVNLGPLAIREGCLHVSSEPGMGGDFDWAWVERVALATV